MQWERRHCNLIEVAKEKKDVSGRLIVGTVRGDLHDIGKNMVVTMLRGVGFEVTDLGINISEKSGFAILMWRMFWSLIIAKVTHRFP